MKLSRCEMLSVGLLVLMCAACSRDNEPAPVAPPAAAQKGDVPSEVEIAGFLPMWQDPENEGVSVEFDIAFEGVPLSPAAADEFRERGKVPFVIGVGFAKYNRHRPGRSEIIMEGQAEIAVLDAEGNLVDRQRKDLELLCPS